MNSLPDHIRCYYEALNTGDADLWRDPKSGERRLNRGTEWFRFRDGKICEVRAYHHGDRKNPQGDLIGFDHEGRGYTTLPDWKPPEKKAAT